LHPSPILSHRCPHHLYNPSPPISPSPFFFYSSGHPRDLHSFPTRRSSDLCASCAHPRRGNYRLAQARDITNCEDCWRHNIGLGRDRKSTRLNSSHVSISYAVFCLKKKKRNMNKINYLVNK